MAAPVPLANLLPASAAELPRELEPSMKFPMMGGPRAKLAELFLKDASAYVLSLEFDDLCTPYELDEEPLRVDLSKTKETVLRPISQGNGTTWELLHAIPRRELVSIVLGTVAYDAYRSRPAVTRLANLELDCGGVYVVGISVNGRGGKFLNAREYARLAERVEWYLRYSKGETFVEKET